MTSTNITTQRCNISSCRLKRGVIDMLLVLTILLSFISAYCAQEDTSYEVVQWSNITVHARNGAKRTILQLGPGAIKSGRVLGILGPSGSGKTTFLNVISRRKLRRMALWLSSDATYATKLGPTAAQSVGFVHQDDFFFETLMVEETLALMGAFHSIKHGSQSTMAHDNDVQALIHSLGLGQVSSLKVGNSVSGGISGGERKRLSVACELLGNPHMLIADEPTSGLDAHQAYQVVSQLHSVAKDKNIAVVCTIHQPRSSIWNLFDDILVLAPNGRCAYHGAKEDVLPFFKSLGYVCPTHSNPADFLIDTISIDTTSEEAKIISHERIETISKAFANQSRQQLKQSSSSGTAQDDHGEEDVVGTRFGRGSAGRGLMRVPLRRLFKLPQWSSASERRIQHVKPSMIVNAVFSRLGRSARRFSLVFWRSLMQTLREPVTIAIRLGTTAALAFIVASIYGAPDRALTEASTANRVNLLAHSVVNIAMQSVVKTLQLFKKERTVVVREQKQGHYLSFEYLAAKSFTEYPMDILNAMVFGVILHQRGQVSMGLSPMCALLALLSCACSSFGLAVGAVCPTSEVSLVVGPAIMIVYVMMGAIGAGGAGATLPALLQPLRDLSPVSWGSKALLSAEFAGKSFAKSATTKIASVGTLRTILRYVLPNRRLGKRAGEVDLGRERSDGDYVLDELGIGGATVSSSGRSLGMLFAGHSLVALIGLLVSK